jgi:O-antigen/teichoic acid export membrane protein
MNQTVFAHFRSGILNSAIFLPLGVGISFLMNIVLARLLNLQEYGLFVYTLSFVSILAVVVSLGLPTGTMRFIAEYRIKEMWGCFKGILVSTFFILLSTSFIIASLLSIIVAFMPIAVSIRETLFFSALLLPPVTLGFWRSHALRGLHRIRESILPKEVFVPLAMVIISLLLGHNIEGKVLVIYCLILIIMEIFGFWWLWRCIPEFAKATTATYNIRLWLNVSFPMALSSLMRLGMNRWDILILGAVVNMEIVGFYSVALRISSLVSLILQIVNTVVGPLIATVYYGGRRHELLALIYKGIFWSAVCGIPLFFLIFLWPNFVLQLFGLGFEEASGPLRILVFGHLVNTITGPIGLVLLMTGYEKIHAKLTFGATLLNLSANAVLIPLWGAMGAAVAQSATLILLNVGLLIAVCRHVLKPYNLRFAHF